MNNTKQSGFLGFLKAVFASFGAEQAGEIKIRNEKPSKRKVATVKKASVRRNDWKRQSRSANARRIFANGQVLTAAVKRVDQASAYFTVKGACSVVVSAKSCEESGTIRFADLRVGQTVRVRVKAWYPQTQQIVLSGVEEILTAGLPNKANIYKHEFKPLKPSYETLPKGTVVLIDGANLLHKFEPAEAPKVLRSVVDGLKEQGYDARIYLEHRVWMFMCFHQGSEEASEKFKALCRELDVTIVGREADLAILQVLKTVPESVGLTNDRYSDYAKTFPDLVGTPRLRGFSVTKIDDLKLISVDGLSKAVKVEQTEQKVQEPEESIVQDPVVEEPVVERPQPVRTFSNDVKGGFCGYGNVLLAKGNVQGAIRCFKKGIARHQSEGYAGLAEICHSQGDAKGAIKFTQLGEKLQRRLRDQKLRKRRLWAERRRASYNPYALCA